MSTRGQSSLHNLCVVLQRAGLQAMAEEDDLSSKRHDDDDDYAAGEKDHLGVAVAEERGSGRKRG